jgi:hypothetical protein
MKKLGMIIALLTAATAFSAENGDDAKVLGFGVFGGAAVPLDRMGAELGVSPTIGVKVLWTVPGTEKWEAELDFGYNVGFVAKDTAKPEEGGIEVPGTTSIPILVGLNYKDMPEKIGFYLGGGGGANLEKYGAVGQNEPVQPPGAEADAAKADINNVGAYFGAGFLWNFLGAFILDVSPRLNYVPNEGDYKIKTGPGTEIPVPKDFKDAYVAVTLGVNGYVF